MDLFLLILGVGAIVLIGWGFSDAGDYDNEDPRER
jgi:hypothetical protein